MFAFPPVTQSDYLAALQTSRYGRYGETTVHDRRLRRSARARNRATRKGGRA